MLRYHHIAIIVVSAIASMAMPAQAQMRRIMAYTTEQTIARTEMTGELFIETEMIEAYDCDIVDEQPQFPGGNNALVHYINGSRKYPAEAYERGIHGKVLCVFVVQPDGEITHINVLKGVEPSLDREAVRVLNEMPRWQAGRLGGRAVPVLCYLPITFRL